MVFYEGAILVLDAPESVGYGAKISDDENNLDDTFNTNSMYKYSPGGRICWLECQRGRLEHPQAYLCIDEG